MSWLRTSIASGVPSVAPSCSPETISTVSGSLRCVVMALWPGRRRSSSRWISSAATGIRGGQPSITTPTAAPCDSPNVGRRSSWPNVFPGIVPLVTRQDVDHAAVDGFAREHEHAPAAFFYLQVQIAGRAEAPDVGAAGGALRDPARDLDVRASREPLHIGEVVVADAFGRRHGDLQIADLAQHEQAIVGLVA